MSNENKNDAYLKWPKLIQGRLIKRYKRFMADVKLLNGHVVTAHCPNSGSMAECSEPGRRVFLSRSSNPSRRLKYTWEMIKMPSSLVGVNTMIPNRLTKVSIISGKIPELDGYDKVRAEVKYGKNSRIDLLLENNGKRCFVEVKNCTLVRDGIAYFPDAVTSRGLKHLKELQAQVSSGDRAVMFFLIQRMDAGLFRPAGHIDPVYARELKKAAERGVEIIAYDVIIDIEGIRLNRPMPFKLNSG
jgi:sugar fermentation stimulation protein A